MCVCKESEGNAHRPWLTTRAVGHVLAVFRVASHNGTVSGNPPPHATPPHLPVSHGIQASSQAPRQIP